MSAYDFGLMASIASAKQRARIYAGWGLHKLNAYRVLLPYGQRHSNRVRKRLEDYLRHYYQSVDQADAIMKISELDAMVACDLRDHMLEPYLAGTHSIYEMNDIRHCRDKARAGDHILDIGANHGFWGVALARKIAPHVKLYLAEPNPTLIRRLRKTLRMNELGETVLIEKAINDGTAMEVPFYLPRDNLSGLGSTVLSSHALENSFLDETRMITAAATSIDDLMHSGIINGIDLLKIDVEHAEDSVIEGGAEALKRFRPRLIMVETSPESAAARCITGLGYSSYKLDKRGHPESIPGNYWGNIYFERKNDE